MEKYYFYTAMRSDKLQIFSGIYKADNPNDAFTGIVERLESQTTQKFYINKLVRID